MKKIAGSILSGILVLGAGTAVFAAGTTTEGAQNFDDMKPMMQQMHPEFSDAELENMYNSCHGKDSQMQSNHMKSMKEMKHEMRMSNEVKMNHF